jgi:hypothetical protein
MKPGARPFEGAPVLGRFAGYLGVEPPEVYELFDLVNLVEYYPGPAKPGSRWDSFPVGEAVRNSVKIREGLLTSGYERLVTIGRAATSVFWGDRVPRAWFEWFEDPELPGVRCSCSPHPGGTSMWWNSPENRELGVAFWRELRDWVRAGELLDVARPRRPRDPEEGALGLRAREDPGRGGCGYGSQGRRAVRPGLYGLAGRPGA